jgi:hypothetical protein
VKLLLVRSAMRVLEGGVERRGCARIPRGGGGSGCGARRLRALLLRIHWRSGRNDERRGRIG